MSVLHRLEEPLDALSEKLGVAKLSSFYDYSELEKAHDPDTQAIREPQWFDSAEGLQAVRRLRSVLQADFAALGWVPQTSADHWSRQLLDELFWCEEVLEKAHTKRREFRLLVVP
jgi:hypothetical protein